MSLRIHAAVTAGALAMMLCGSATAQEKTQKPPLHGSHWMAITGKPLAATRARACSNGRMRSTPPAPSRRDLDDGLLSWGGRRRRDLQPRRQEIVAINVSSIAPTGATAEFSRAKHEYPPDYGSARRRHARHARALGHDARGVRQALAREVLAPANELADGYPSLPKPRTGSARERTLAVSVVEGGDVPHLGEGASARAGEIFRPPGSRCDAQKARPLAERPAKIGKRGPPCRPRRPSIAGTSRSSSRSSGTGGLSRERPRRWRV